MSKAKKEFSNTAASRLDAQLIAAAKEGNAEQVLRALLAGADINAKDLELGRTAAHWAAAANSIGAVLILNVEQDGEAAALTEYAPTVSLDEQALSFWRVARRSRKVLAVDDIEGCFPSAFAALGSDASERSKIAQTIWQHLMRTEGDAAGSPFALLEIWKPSSVMNKSASLHNAELPDGFSNPLPDINDTFDLE